MLNIPDPQNYLIVYKTDKGPQAYTVSLPIEKNDDSITVYAFGHGVRTFKVDKIQDMRVLGPSVLNG